MQFYRTKSFTKALQKLPPRLLDAVEESLILFEQDRTSPRIRDHALKGRLKGLRAFSAGWDLRIIYREEGGFITIILLDVGSHNQVY